MPIRFHKDNRRPLSTAVLLLLVLLLAACRTGTPSPGPVESTDPPPTSRPIPPATRTPRPPTPTPQPTSRLDIEPSALQGAGVVFWHVWAGEAGQAVDELVDEFNRSNEWGIQVQAVYQGNYDQLSDKLRAALSEGQPPDLALAYSYQAQAWGRPVETPSPEGGAGQTPAVQGSRAESPSRSGEEAVLADIDTYATDPVWGFSAEEQADFWEATDGPGGSRVGIPAQRSAQVLYYNASWARELGFSKPPATPAEFERQACAAAQANRQDDNPDNDLTGGWIISTHYAAISSWIYAFGGQVAGPGGEGYELNTTEAERALTFLRRLYDQGCAWLSENEPGEGDFTDRQGLFASGTVAGIPQQAVLFERAGSGDEWFPLPYPSPSGEPAITVYGPSFHILKSRPERQLAAWLFVKWLASPESQARLSQASGYFPVRRSAVDLLLQDSKALPQWTAALELIQYARPEPALPSWNTVRWAVSDAATQLFRYYFTIDQVPDLVKLLDETAEDLHQAAR